MEASATTCLGSSSPGQCRVCVAHSCELPWAIFECPVYASDGAPEQEQLIAAYAHRRLRSHAMLAWFVVVTMADSQSKDSQMRAIIPHQGPWPTYRKITICYSTFAVELSVDGTFRNVCQTDTLGELTVLDSSIGCSVA
jgi:hypothetical protein